MPVTEQGDTVALFSLNHEISREWLDDELDWSHGNFADSSSAVAPLPVVRMQISMSRLLTLVQRRGPTVKQHAAPIHRSISYGLGQRSIESDSRKIGFELVGMGARSDQANISVRANEHICSDFHSVRSLELALGVTELQPVAD